MGVYPVNAAVNAVICVPVSKGVHPHEDILTCATEIRASLGRLKDPRLIKEIVADVAKTQSQLAWDKSGQDLHSTGEGRLIVNNTWK